MPEPDYNPYAAPQSEVVPSRQEPGIEEGAWRDGSLLVVVSQDAELPDRCVKCNAPAGGYHRLGTLAFPLTQSDGSPVLAGDTQQIELSIREVGGVQETVLRWALS